MLKPIIYLIALTILSSACASSDSNTTPETPAEPTETVAPEEAQVHTEQQHAEPAEQPAEPETAAEVVPEITDHVDISNDDWEPDYDMFYEGREFMIILSSKDFQKSVEFATIAAESLQLELKIDAIEEVDGHLSFPQAECEGGGFDYPCYIARGRYDDGDYVSIEQSDAYDGFTRGYYIVVVSSGPKGDPNRRDLLVDVKNFYDDAYIKSTQVYMGCMH